MKKGAFWAIGLIAVVGIAVRYSSAGTLEDGAKSTDASIVTQSSVSPVQSSVNLEVKDFMVNTVRGESIQLSKLVEEKPTMVGFWASWCPNCQRNLPIQNELFKKYKDQVNIIEINLREPRVAVDRYAKDKDYDFHMAYDEDGVVSGNWNVPYTNTHFLIGADGSLLDAFPGDVTEAHFEQLIAGTKS